MSVTQSQHKLKCNKNKFQESTQLPPKSMQYINTQMYANFKNALIMYRDEKTTHQVSNITKQPTKKVIPFPHL